MSSRITYSREQRAHQKATDSVYLVSLDSPVVTFQGSVSKELALEVQALTLKIIEQRQAEKAAAQ